MNLGKEIRELEVEPFAWAWSKVSRGITAGLAEWYKEELLKQQFEQEQPPC